MTLSGNSTAQVIARAIRAHSNARGVSLERAARVIANRHPSECLAVLETIGSWPSSEPELRALQQVKGR